MFKVISPDGEEKIVPGKSTHVLAGNTRIWARLAGGGGWGNPLERETWRVLEDVRNGKVTPEHAREAYGVVIDVRSMTIDEEATISLRAARTGLPTPATTMKNLGAT